MRRLRLLPLLLMLLPTMALARQSLQGDCVLGGKIVVTNGLNSTTKVMASYPSCTVTISIHGGGLATIYSDNSGTILANPFTATTAGHFQAYADNGHYDVLISGGTPQAMPTSFTYSDIILNDASQFSTSVCGLSFSASVTFTASTCSDFTLTLTGNVTSSSITGAVTGQLVNISLCQDATGGRTFAWPGSFTRPPTVLPTAGTCTNTQFFFDGINWRQAGATGDALVASGGSLSGSFAGDTIWTGNPSFTGNVSVPGTFFSNGLSFEVTGGFSVISNINGTYAPSGLKYATMAALQAAMNTDQPSKPTVAIISPLVYPPTDCPVAQNNQIFIDYRAGGRSGSGTSSYMCTQNIIQYGTKTPGLTDAMIRPEMTRTSVDAAGSVVTEYIIAHLTNATVSGGVVDGASTEAQINGTLTGTLAVLNGNEAPATITSTGGTVSVAVGLQGYVFSTLGSTTAVGNAWGIWGRGCNGTISGATPANCAGGYFSRQLSTASGRNYSVETEGLNVFDYDSSLGIGGFDCEDTAHTARRCFFMDSLNDIVIEGINAAGTFLRASSGADQLRISASGAETYVGLFPHSAGLHAIGTGLLPYSSIFIGAAATNNSRITGTMTAARTATVPDASGTFLLTGNGNTPIQTKRAVAGCATAASIGATCNTTITWITAFADTSYGAWCQGVGSTSGAPLIWQTSAKVAASITVPTIALTAAAAQFTNIECVAVHD
jgi:hypothetical protein